MFISLVSGRRGNSWRQGKDKKCLWMFIISTLWALCVLLCVILTHKASLNCLVEGRFYTFRPGTGVMDGVAQSPVPVSCHSKIPIYFDDSIGWCPGKMPGWVTSERVSVCVCVFVLPSEKYQQCSPGAAKIRKPFFRKSCAWFIKISIHATRSSAFMRH